MKPRTVCAVREWKEENMQEQVYCLVGLPVLRGLVEDGEEEGSLSLSNALECSNTLMMRHAN